MKRISLKEKYFVHLIVISSGPDSRLGSLKDPLSGVFLYHSASAYFFPLSSAAADYFISASTSSLSY